MDKLRVGVLGATGLVGQRFVHLLSRHPWFRLEYLAASPGSAGRRYGDVVSWYMGSELDDRLKGFILGNASDPASVPRDLDVVFSALPSSVAMDVEVPLARNGFLVVSNASPMRLERDVPLLNPEVNYEHIKALELQARLRGWRGRLIKNPNCSTAILTLSLAPLRKYGVREVIVTTLQAISGAGLRGVNAYSIVDNVIPYIEREEFKLREETRKILGRLSSDGVEPGDVRVSATTTRVPVLDGHMESVHVRLERAFDVGEVLDELRAFSSLPQELGLPTAPRRPIVVMLDRDRPQPRLDRYVEGGMAVAAGRVEVAESLPGRWLKYVVLGHNTVRGAAGTAVLIAELYFKMEGMV